MTHCVTGGDGYSLYSRSYIRAAADFGFVKGLQHRLRPVQVQPQHAMWWRQRYVNAVCCTIACCIFFLALLAPRWCAATGTVVMPSFLCRVVPLLFGLSLCGQPRPWCTVSVNVVCGFHPACCTCGQTLRDVRCARSMQRLTWR